MEKCYWIAEKNTNRVISGGLTKNQVCKFLHFYESDYNLCDLLVCSDFELHNYTGVEWLNRIEKEIEV